MCSQANCGAFNTSTRICKKRNRALNAVMMQFSVLIFSMATLGSVHSWSINAYTRVTQHVDNCGKVVCTVHCTLCRQVAVCCAYMCTLSIVIGLSKGVRPHYCHNMLLCLCIYRHDWHTHRKISVESIRLSDE